MHYSSVNYKDALAATGSGKILRRHPLTRHRCCGIVLESKDERFEKGEEVLVTGCGIGRTSTAATPKSCAPAPTPSSNCPRPKPTRGYDLGHRGFTAALGL